MCVSERKEDVGTLWPVAAITRRSSGGSEIRGTELRFGSAFVQECHTGPKGPKQPLHENKRNQETVQLKINSDILV